MVPIRNEQDPQWFQEPSFRRKPQGLAKRRPKQPRHVPRRVRGHRPEARALRTRKPLASESTHRQCVDLVHANAYYAI